MALSSSVFPELKFRNGASKKFRRSLLRGATPPVRTWELKNRDSYTSQAFNGKGWIFAGYYFYASSGTGEWLLWQSVRDSALIGDMDQANATYKYNKGHGEVLNQGAAQYKKSRTGLMTYFSFNPVSNSYYIVSNI